MTYHDTQTETTVNMLRTRSPRLRDILATVERIADAGLAICTLSAADYDYLADQFARETGGRLNLADANPYGVHILRHNPKQAALL